MGIHKVGYELIQNAVPEETCSKFSKILFDLYDKSQYKIDKQCDMSQSFYGVPEFDNFLEDFTPFIKKLVKQNIVPTYSYARIYRKGEELKRHFDREECEYTVTITLDHHGEKSWPFFLKTKGSEEEFIIKKGSILVYRGNKLIHWRNILKHKWQTQLFLHYIKSDGYNLKNKDRLLSLALKGGLIK